MILSSHIIGYLKPSHLLPILVSLVLGACAGIPIGPGRPGDFPTRDVGSVAAACSQIVFIVSLNDDDDNANRLADRTERANPATEDNVREFVVNKSEGAD